MTDVIEQRYSQRDTSENSEDTIVSRFERQVATAPEKQAIVTDEISLSYRMLDQHANRIAAARALRSGQSWPIMIFMGGEVARVTAMLGTLKANRIFIPLAPNSPEKWISEIIRESGAAQVIVDGSTRLVAQRAAAGNATVIEFEQLARSSEQFVFDQVSGPNDTATIVYTSGSTGRPKGVAKSHRSLVRLCDVRRALFGFGRGDRCANLRSSGVASGILNTLLPLLGGSCLLPFDLHRHGLQKLAPWLIAQKITYVSFSSSLLRTWLASLSDDLRLPALRFVSATGERLYAEDVLRISRHLERDWLFGYSYSSTESGTIAAQVFTPLRLPDTDIVAVGSPIDGVDVSLKDEKGAIVAPGEVGEIVVRSRFLAQKYWNNPELTQEAFQTDPLDSDIRTYRTGDLGRWRSDGMLEHVGRKGRRIRLRGYNIEPLQVERELMRLPGVTEAVVTLHESNIGLDPVLVGYVIAPADTSPSFVRKRLGERLPSYMVPSHIVVLDSFPVTISGKIDRKALPPPDREGARPAELRSPATEIEHQLLLIWQEILKSSKIGIDDDFFELGGTSLQALMVFAKIETWFGCSLSPTTIMRAPTIARLADLIQATTDVAASQSLVALRASGAGLPLFLVHGRDISVMGYRHLVNDLRGDRPLYGLQPLPLDGRHRIARTIEAMAADYVTEIRQVQPHGPYFLAGHSFGGRVSFEIAQQLACQGERVGFLGLIDTIQGRPNWVSKARQLGHRVRHVNGFFDLLFRGLTFIRWRARDVRRSVWFWVLDLWIRRGRSIPYEHRLTYYDCLCVRANRQYVPKPYGGHITIFSSAGNSERQTAHWGPLGLGGLTVLEVPGGHHGMMLPPHSKVLAQYFDRCLDA
jgi:amino acid adenylation domain-containing protein